MENFIKKIINNESISDNELNLFIVDYCKLMDKKEPTQEEITKINLLIKNGIFDLMYIIKVSAIKLNISLNSLYDKNNQLIKIFIV